MYVEIQVSELKNGWTVTFHKGDINSREAYIAETLDGICSRIGFTLTEINMRSKKIREEQEAK